MKESEYNEIDRLLRNLAARERSQPGDAASGSGAHLDADELNSYAEGALPPATRARYTSHLADCDDCRRSVAQLSIASGSLSSERKSSQELAPSVWKQIVTALFTPLVLRYVMPALALVFVVTFAFMAWRQRDESFVAANRQNVNAPAPSATQTFGDTATRDSQAGSKTSGEQEQQKEKSKTKPESGPESSPATTAADKPAVTTDKKKDEDAVGSGNTAESKAESKERDVAKNEIASAPRGAYASEPVPAAPKPTAVMAKSPTKVSEERADKLEPKDASAARKEPEQTKAGIAVQSANAGIKSNAREKAKASAPATAQAGEAGDDRQAGKGESRIVNGRRFQRRNGAWVDAAYDSSSATTNLKRGSEQYRALVADEPSIDSIVKQLSGEVILVWKGRAYRIR